MALASTQVLELEKLIVKEERRKKAGRSSRWFLLGFGIFLLGHGIWCLVLASRCWNSMFVEATTIQVNRCDLMGVSLSNQAFVMAMFSLPFGCWLVTNTVIAWNKWKRESLLINLARCYVQEQQSKGDAAP